MNRSPRDPSTPLTPYQIRNASWETLRARKAIIGAAPEHCAERIAIWGEEGWRYSAPEHGSVEERRE
jgi:hypothetical protein